MFHVFKRKKSSPLEDAFNHLHQIFRTVYNHQNDQNHIPTVWELAQYELLAHQLWEASVTVERIAHKLHERLDSPLPHTL